MTQVKIFLEQHISGLSLPDIQLTDIAEIIVIALIVYQVMLWIKNTKAWMLLKGIIVLALFILIAAILQMDTILYLAKASIGVLATAAVVVFQPEMRRALEKLGQKNIILSIVPFDKSKESERFSEETIKGILDAAFEMSKVKTGALIVVEKAIKLTEFETTGIILDCLVSSQVLINIFEHNTPLHDGAIIIRENRIVSATCYLPLSDNMELSKEFGTRHRAAVGMSEVSDALVIAVSEETGYVSVAVGGRLIRNISREDLLQYLNEIQNKVTEGKKNRRWKGRQKNEK